jgi:hypothetical protein
VLVNSLSLSPNTVSRERRAFAYYFEFAASSVGGGLDLDFWRTLVPQVCRYEPAVWDAIISIGALFECSKEGSNIFIQRQKDHKDLDQNHQDILAWYSRSVSAIRRRIESGSVDAFVGLISCALFICIEALQGDAGGALKLFTQGVRLIIALRPQIDSGAIPASQAALLEDTIIPIFVRLAASALAIDGLPVTSLLRDTGSSTMFESIKSAREAIVSLAIEIPLFETKCMDRLLHGVAEVPEEFIARKILLATKLRNWYTAFNTLTEVLCDSDVPPEQFGTAALTLAYHEMLYITLETCTSLSLTNFDAFIPNFQRIVEQSAIALKASRRSDGTQPPFTFEISVGLPLWFTSLRCRDPRTRRAALTLLRQAPPVQGFYQCSVGTAVGERIMELEEACGMNLNAAQQDMITTTVPTPGLELIGGSHSASAEIASNFIPTVLIPEEARIGPITLFRPRDGLPAGTTQEDLAEWNRGSEQAFLRFCRNERGLDDNSWRMVYQYVPFDYPLPSLSYEVACVELMQ